MNEREQARLAHERARFMRPDAARYLRPDAHRFAPPGQASAEHLRTTNAADVAARLRSRAAESARDTEQLMQDLAQLRQEHFELRAIVARLKFEHLWRRLVRKYREDQPRVPRDHPGGGQWTRDGGGAGNERVRLAGNDGPRLGRPSLIRLGAELAKRLIDAYRTENSLRDLFGSNSGTVALTSLDGQDIFGSNSKSPTYTKEDRLAAEELRSRLIEKYPEVMSIDHPGRRPNDAVFHAETNVLLRAARENGGTLSGRSLEVYIDRSLCPSCRFVQPYIGVELGNPRVTFIDHRGLRQTMHNGRWIKEQP